MYLYKNKELFNDLLIRASRDLKINEALLEKDYFVMLLLSELNKSIPGLLFKGGTSCSRAYYAIDRFSEDIDLSLDLKHLGRTHNIYANHKVIEVCDRLGFKIINRDEVEKHSHGNFNCYYIEYPIVHLYSSVKPYLQVEMTFYIPSYPSETKEVSSLLKDYLASLNRTDIIQEYDLSPFKMSVQTLERTFIDKVFAICDYYERKEDVRNSRHIYDLYKIYQLIEIHSSSFKDLVHNVRNERRKNKTCLSSHDGYQINQTLKKIKNEAYFKRDYNQVTIQLLTKQARYDESIQVLDKIIQSKSFE